jgi:hypothetical protein
VTTEKHLGALDEPGMKEVRPGVWSLRIFVGRRPNGSPVQRRRTVDSGTGRVGVGVREARMELAKMRAEVQEDGGTRRTMAASSYTVEKLLDRYIAHCEQQGRSPTTLHEYRRLAAKVLVPRFGTMKVADLDQDHLDALYDELGVKGLGAQKHPPRPFPHVGIAPVRAEEEDCQAQHRQRRQSASS